MPYAIPHPWAHGDLPLASEFNKYKDGLDAIYALRGSVETNPAVAAQMDDFTAGVVFVHRNRYLWHLGDARIEDMAGIGETVNSAGAGGNWVLYDLAQIEWLYPGKLYIVDDVIACFEDYES